jgi:hypothetical protein
MFEHENTTFRFIYDNENILVWEGEEILKWRRKRRRKVEDRISKVERNLGRKKVRER